MNRIISPIERKQWFIDRIGKRIFRDASFCDCPTCQRNYNEGLIIKDLTHAIYLYDVECDLNREGKHLRYFEAKEIKK